MGKIAEIVVPAGGQATIDFTAIPQTYRHLAVIVRGRGTDTGGFYTTLRAQINGDTGASYDGQRLDASASNGNGTNVAGATSFDLGYFESGSAPAGSQSSNDYELLYYTDTTLRKQIKGRYNLAQGNAGIWTGIMDGEWRNTAAISRLTLSLATGNFAAGTVATLYGVDAQGAFVAPQTASGTMDLVRDYLAVHNGDPIDTVIQNGPWVALVYFAGANTNAWVSATNAHWTVSTGKTLVVVEYLPALKTQYDNAARANRLQNTTDNVTVVDNTFGRAGWPYVGDVTQTVGLATVAAGKTVVLQVQNADTTKRANGVVVLCREV